MSFITPKVSDITDIFSGLILFLPLGKFKILIMKNILSICKGEKIIIILYILLAYI